MQCTKCGSNNSDNALFCAKCGATMQPAAASNEQAPAQPPPPPPPSYPQQQPPFQPGAMPYQSQPNIPNFMVWSILNIIFCCLPLGIFGVIKSSEVNSKLAMQDYIGAKSASDTARTVNLIGTIVGGIGTFLYIILIAAGALSDM